MTGPSFGERFPPWLVITAAVLVAFIIGLAAILILAGYTLEDFAAFLGDSLAGILALVAAAKGAQASTQAAAARRDIAALRSQLDDPAPGRHSEGITP